MRRDVALLAAALAAISLAPAATPTAAHAQDLAARLDRVRDGTVRLSFATRAGVCGDGRFIGEDTPDGFRTWTIWSGGYSINMMDRDELWAPDCKTGPLRLVVKKTAGRVAELRAAVGVDWKSDVTVPDLGRVPAPEAADWLLGVAKTTDDDVARVAMLAANMADGARIADRLIEMAKDRKLDPDVRERAMRWVSEAAMREGKAGEADRTLRTIAAERDESADLRERAIRELWDTPENDAYLKDLLGKLSRTDLKERIVRRLGESKGGANADWVRQVALDSGEPTDVRERAIRVLGEIDRGQVRDLYGRLRESELKDRALRVAAEDGSEETSRWLRTIAESRAEPTDVRERAIRLLGERGGAMEYLKALYGRLDREELKQRVVRLVGEDASPDARAWLRSVATDDAQPTDVRERAVRVLAEGQSTADLADLYDRLDRRDLRVRTIRLLAERGDDVAVDKLISIARSDPDSDLHREALRRLAETGNPKARSFLEEAVKRPSQP